MSILYETVPAYERRAPVDYPTREERSDCAPVERTYFKRTIPSEILDSLPESSVDPLPNEPEDGGGSFDTRSSAALAGGSTRGGRAITLVGSPSRHTAFRSLSVDYNRRLYPASDLKSSAEREREGKGPDRGSLQERTLVCQECSSGTFFGLYHTPTTRRKKFDFQEGSSAEEHRWERTPLPAQSTFTAPPKVSASATGSYQSPFYSPYQTKTFHCTPEIRYKPVYFGDPRLRRFSCGYSESRSTRSPASSGLQEFCKSMLAAKTSEGSESQNTTEVKIADVEKEQGNKDSEESSKVFVRKSPQSPKKQTTPLRSPKMVKEVLKRMFSHPSGRDPQVVEAFSDEEEVDQTIDKEALKVIDAFNKSLADITVFDKNTRFGSNIPSVSKSSDSKDQGLQSDNLVEEVMLSDLRFKKTCNPGSVPFSEKYKTREEIEDSRRFMSLTSDKKSKGSMSVGNPAPPKPPRNYDSLPRGFKTLNGDLQYDAAFTEVHPLTNSSCGSQCSSSPQQNYFVVVAIDFGTTYSGYAFCFTQDPDNVHMMRKWEGGDPWVINQKTPTTLLLDPEGHFHSFGYAARDCYHDLEPSEACRWLYFEKFKMELHKTEHLSRETMIYAASGKSLPAMTIFAHALRYFKEHALQELSDQSATDILCDDVRWVVTVPAIWRQQAKQFMRTAAYEAGIASPENPEQLLIALEPEAASIFCRRLKLYQLVPFMTIPQKLSVPNIKEHQEGSAEPAVIENTGTRYMVVDCGGGTVDITVHEIIDENGTIKELHKATGGPFGSVGIDLQFEKLLEDIFGKDFIAKFKKVRPAVFVDLMVIFEARKRNASPFKITPINIDLPYGFVNYYKEIKNQTVEEALLKFNSKEIKWSPQGLLRLEPSAMMNLFQPTVDAIKCHISNILESCKSSGISYLFLVGGFAESAILQKSIRDAFSDKLKVIIPQGVSLAILKGAVQFGVDPTVVSSRRSRLTYGVGILNRFIHGTHPPDKLVIKDGVEWCADIFDKFVLADQSVCIGDAVIRRYTPARSGQACSVIHIYCSERDNATFITDPGVKRCGTLVLDLPEGKPQDPEQKPVKREIQTVMIFGDTELKVSAMDVLTGKCVKAEVDFLIA